MNVNALVVNASRGTDPFACAEGAASSASMQPPHALSTVEVAKVANWTFVFFSILGKWLWMEGRGHVLTSAIQGTASADCGKC